MNDDCANVIRVSLERCDLLRGVIVVYSQLEVIGAADNPVLARNETSSSNRDIGELECLDDCLRLEGPNVCVAAVKSGEDPWLCRMKVDALNSLGTSKQLTLYAISRELGLE